MPTSVPEVTGRSSCPGRTVNPAPGVDLKTTIPAAQLGTSFLVKGRYIEFRVSSANFAVTNWTLTGSPQRR